MTNFHIKREEIKEAFRKYFIQTDNIDALDKEINKILIEVNNYAVLDMHEKDGNLLKNDPKPGVPGPGNVSRDARISPSDELYMMQIPRTMSSVAGWINPINRTVEPEITIEAHEHRFSNKKTKKLRATDARAVGDIVRKKKQRPVLPLWARQALERYSDTEYGWNAHPAYRLAALAINKKNEADDHDSKD